MKRLTSITGSVLTAALLTVGIAAAASLHVTTAGLSAGNASVGRCTSSSLTATRTVDNAGNVTRVDVLSVPQACAGETLTVTLRDGSPVPASLGTASAVVGACTGGCTVAVTGFGTVSAAGVASYAFSLAG